MSVHAGEYHPYGACLMYKGCGNAATVRENLTYIKEIGIDEINKELDELKKSNLEALRAWAGANKMYNKKISELEERIKILTKQRNAAR